MTQPVITPFAISKFATGLLLLVVASYLPGLGGEYVFDDFTNIVENTALRPTDITWDTLAAAAMSADAGPLKRPIPSLTFLANFELFGVNPLSHKVTNLVIHLCNVWLVFVLLRRLLAHAGFSIRRAIGVAGITASLWAIHPINLTAVLYIVQRMASLAALFMLLAMLSYAKAREATIHQRGGAALGWLGVVIFAALGAMSKENALLLPCFLALIECCIYRFERAAWLKWIYGGGILLTALLAWYLLGPLQYFANAYLARPFTMLERVLTEARIVTFYLKLIVLPNPTEMALLHSDWKVSHSLWSPPSTILANAFWVTLVAAAVMSARRHPLFAFSVGWFIAGHLLESTVVPLDLIYEHRNYVPSIGVLLLISVCLSGLCARAPHLKPLLVGGIIIVLGAMTLYRSWQWGDPFTLALTEARHNPTSGRARYEMGRLYFKLYGINKRPELLEKVRHELKAAVEYGEEDFHPLAALINSYLIAHEPVPEEIVLALENELRVKTPSARRLDGLAVMVNCQLHSKCPVNPAVVIRAFGAMLENPRLSPRLKSRMLEWMTLYYSNVLVDYAAAQRIMEDAVQLQPKNWSYRLRVLELEVIQGNWEDARTLADQLDPVMNDRWRRISEKTLTSRFDKLVAQIESHDSGNAD